VQCATCRDFASEILDAQHLGVGVGHTHHGVARCDRIDAEKCFNAEHAFITDGRRLDHRAVRQDGHNGRDAAIQEIHGPEWFAAFVKHLLHPERNGRHVRQQAAEVSGMQRGE
jgi:hypothetical protein